MRRWLADSDATKAMGQDLASELLNRQRHNSESLPVLMLGGSLGAGKTCLTRGLARGLGIEEPITSPTFALAQHYVGRRERLPTALVHLDLYRLELPAAADELFLQEQELAQEQGALLVVEWPERLSFGPPGSWCVTLEVLGEGRMAHITLPGETL